MDFSKQYILMCEKAEEIQKNNRFPEEGIGIERNDYFAHKDGYEIDASDLVWNTKVNAYVNRSPNPFGCVVDERPIVYNKGEIIWLPRQDQLQEILSTKQFFENLDHQAIQFNNFCGWFQESKNRQFFSFEQLWLAFVMKEKFQKIWQDNEWIII